MDLEDWCQQNGLFTATARQLRHEGFVTAEDLRDVTEDDVRETFQKRGKLPLQQCVALREALADFCHGKARRRRRKGVSIAEWSMAHDLDSETRKVLEKEGFTTADDMNSVTALDVKTTFQQRGTLPLQQCIALRKALEESSSCRQTGGKEDSGRPVPAADRHHGQAHRTSVCSLSVDRRADHQSSPPTPTTHSRHSDEDDSDSISSRGKDDARGEDILAFPSSATDSAQHPGQYGHRVGKSESRHQRGVEYRVVVAGTEQSGKTRTIQTILGQRGNTIHSLRGETGRGRIHQGHLLGHSVQILNTSGWLDPSRAPSEVATNISSDLQHLRPGAHAVLYTVDISDRFTTHQDRYYRQLRAVFSHALPLHLILVFTHADTLFTSGKDMQHLLQGAPTALQKLMKECRGRYVLFDNKTLCFPSQKRELLWLLEKLKSYNLPKPYLSVEDGVAEIARRLSEVGGGGQLTDQASFVQAGRPQQQQRESRKQRKSSRKALD